MGTRGARSVGVRFRRDEVSEFLTDPAARVELPRGNVGSVERVGFPRFPLV